MKTKLKNKSNKKRVPTSKLPEPENAKQETGGACDNMAMPQQACIVPDSELVQASRRVEWSRKDILYIQNQLEENSRMHKALLNNLEHEQLSLVQDLENLKGLM